MKRILLVICTIFSTFLMISSVTAVPKVNSNPLVEKINLIEEYQKLIDEEVNDIILDVESGGLIIFII